MGSLRRFSIVVLLLALALPGAAAATIVPQQGMAGVTISMTRAQVRAKLGPPLAYKQGRTALGPFREYRYAGITVTFQGRVRVSAIATYRRKERTRDGVGVGSTEAQVKRKVSGARCMFRKGYRHCYVGSVRPGARVTDFYVRRGRVARVTIGALRA